MITECSQTPLCEALRDGRLGAHEAASMERHVAGCPHCRAVSRELELIGETMRGGEEPLLPLEHQRARKSLLSRAMQESTHKRASSRRGARSALSLALVAAMLVAAVSTTWALTRVSGSRAPVLAFRMPPLPRVPVSSDTVIQASRGARFEHNTDGSLETLKLSSGDLDVHVRTLAQGDRFLVKTSDAEIEVKGTSFQVAAENGRIRSVAVHEGSVEVRYAGFTAIIPGGGSWRANGEGKPDAALADKSASSDAARDRSASHDDSVGNARHSATARAAKAPTVKDEPVASPPKVDESPAPPARSPASIAFADAMSALAVGDNVGAAARFQSFSRAYASDPRADEADYLHAIALQRSGNGKEAAAAGKRYLEGRPNGAHRQESALIAGASTP